MSKFSSKAALLTVGATALIFALPALGQQNPESLLPPGFGTPPPPAPPSPPSSGQPSGPTATTPTRPTGPSTSTTPATTGDSADEEDATDDTDDEEELEVRYDVPPAARRSLKAVGIMSEASGGFPAAAFGETDGQFLGSALRRTTGPLASRWATIMGRRMLVSRTDTPRNINGADWAAERAWLLLRMGDSVAARQLVQEVDAGNYTKRLLEVSMQAFLANGDLSGMCPVADAGARQVGSMSWKLARPICASLSDEQANATALLNQSTSFAKGIDYLLTEKAVGAGINGRRSVKIEWDKVNDISAWRYGLGVATGVEPPERLYDLGGKHMDGWRVQLPMLSIASRLKAAPGAASLGVLSNRSMVDLYSQALDDSDVPDDAKARSDLLQTAYAGDGASARVGAMASLWDGAKLGADYQAMLVLTARAAAMVAPSSSQSGASDRLISSMMTAGFDTQAAAWRNVVEEGSLGWALIAVGAPQGAQVAAGSLSDFYGNDDSEEAHKSALLLAGLAGLGRLQTGALEDFGGDLKVNVAKQSIWSRAIDAAAARGESGTVVLLALSALQAPDWRKIPPYHLFYITRSLKQVGLESEARMIAAEAVTFG